MLEVLSPAEGSHPQDTSPWLGLEKGTLLRPPLPREEPAKEARGHQAQHTDPQLGRPSSDPGVGPGVVAPGSPHGASRP